MTPHIQPHHSLLLSNYNVIVVCCVYFAAKVETTEFVFMFVYFDVFFVSERFVVEMLLL